MLCLAKAYGNRPLKRVVAGTAHKLVYVAHPDVADVDGVGVGFPDDAVFAFDADLFARLDTAWNLGEQAQVWALWQTAKPLRLEMQDA